MRIAYLVPWPIEEMAGPRQKLIAQLTSWRRLEHEVALFAVSRGTSAPPGIAGVEVSVAPYRGWAGHLAAVTKAARACLAWGPDVVYSRYDVHYPALPRLARERPLILEINTDDVTDYAVDGSSLRHLYNRLTRRLTLAAAAGLVFVTRELAASGRFPMEKPRTVIANGVDLSEVEEGPAPANEAPRLVVLATNGAVWNGLDLLASMARRFPSWRFDVVGAIERPPAGGWPANVARHGTLSPVEYRPLLDAADAGVGPLALYRKSMAEACPLRVREYLRHGLPVVSAHEDTDFPGGTPFILQLPNRPGGVEGSLERVEAFVAGVRGRRVRRAAVAHIDLGAKEEARLRFLGEVAARSRPRLGA
jgi:hypothetical protein